MIHGRGEVDGGLDRRDAEAAGVAHRLRGVARGDQRLGRHAAVVQAVAAHLGALDQDHARAELRGTGRHGQPRRAGADDAEIALGGHHVFSRRPRSQLHTTGTSESRAKAASGRRRFGSLSVSRSGVRPLSKILSRPAPTLA